MGFLDNLAQTRRNGAKLTRMPRGSFTVDLQGRVVTSTVPQWFPAAQLREIGKQVVAIFAGARQAQLQFTQVIVHYGALKITARHLRGGAIVFLTPKTIESAMPAKR